MALDRARVEELVAAELQSIRDPAVLPRMKALLVAPHAVRRGWDYGMPGEAYDCWTVVEHSESNTGIAYCEDGFGPENPWGLVFLLGPYTSIGMDSAWFPRLEIAFKESMAWNWEDRASRS